MVATNQQTDTSHIVRTVVVGYATVIRGSVDSKCRTVRSHVWATVVRWSTLLPAVRYSQGDSSSSSDVDIRHTERDTVSLLITTTGDPTWADRIPNVSGHTDKTRLAASRSVRRSDVYFAAALANGSRLAIITIIVDEILSLERDNNNNNISYYYLPIIIYYYQ